MSGTETRGRRRARRGASAAGRDVDYTRSPAPFPAPELASEDEIEALHATALRILEELGMKVLLPEARRIFESAGAIVDHDSQMVRIGREIVEGALAAAPRSYVIKGGSPKRDRLAELGQIGFAPASGCPHTTDLARGRRPGRLVDIEELIKITQHYDVLHYLTSCVEPQDAPIHTRHYDVTRFQLVHSDKVPFVYARGTQQVEDVFEMVRIARGVDEDAFRAQPWIKTIINTNSPRQLDIPMSQGIIDFARWGQTCVVTPFCLSGAMAPVSLAGALVLQHAECLAGLTLGQLTKPGAPMMYGNFLSNVDMKSGAPAFGTPEHFKATIVSGQLARKLGLPWRAGGGSAANCGDAQAANENQFALWGAVLAGATMIVHSAGWLEGGLTSSYEKLITDIEVLQMVSELNRPVKIDEDEIGFDAIASVQPGGHFFAGEHTMARYQTAFYAPLVADWSNFGSWTEAGSKTATERATVIWKKILDEFESPMRDLAVLEELDAFVAKRKEEGGAPPVS